ncbi:MAG: Sua5/YciO/YrdC/YwlC family protein [Candidatus Nitrosopelagicus sp.]|nr:Sua5/YciO/YrdC/YwlC family protein [Candidatus Nitrosopelagicus sp.]
MELEKIVEFDSDAEKISQRFWPGQVTLLLPIRKEMSKKIKNNGKLAVRVPNGECILSILRQCKLIIGTSANISGEKSISDSNELKTKLPEIDILVDGGKIVSSGESTIIDYVDNKLRVIREGSVYKDEIENIL